MRDSPVDRTLGARAIVNGRYQSSTKNSLEGDMRLDIPGHGLLNVSLALYNLDARWEVSLWERISPTILLGFGRNQRQHRGAFSRSRPDVRVHGPHEFPIALAKGAGRGQSLRNGNAAG